MTLHLNALEVRIIPQRMGAEGPGGIGEYCGQGLKDVFARQAGLKRSRRSTQTPPTAAAGQSL